MTNETVATEGPSVAGGADFGSPGDNLMSDPDGDGFGPSLLTCNMGILDITPSPMALAVIGLARRTSLVKAVQTQPITMTANWRTSQKTP